jgi:hypothetical protein
MNVLQVPNLNTFCLRELTSNCAVAKNVKSVVLDCRPTCESLWAWYNHNFSNYIAGFTNLTKVTFSVPLKPSTAGPVANPNDQLIFADLDEQIALAVCKKVNKLLGVEYITIKQVPDVFDGKGNIVAIKYSDRYKFVWEADTKKDEVLKKVELSKMFLH